MIELENAVVYHGSNLDVLPTLADNSVDAIVTDPPYELGFMGKSWDSSGIAYSVQLWAECLRVLKPGGHLLAFGGSRTWHRIAVAIEDAGFDVRDSIAWLYGSGFPKSMDISKAIDKAAGAEREVIGSKIASPKGISAAESRTDSAAGAYGGEAKEIDITAPATDEAQQWAGWGTALKPAFEPIVVARKPLPKGSTVAANVLEWGVGGLNIDGSRIGTETIVNQPGGIPNGAGNYVGTDKVRDRSGEPTVAQGRWPANIILDEYTAGLLDEQSGVSTSLSHNRPQATKWGFGVHQDNSKHYDYETGQTGYGDTGGASRFFYVAKASKKDRNEGLEDLEGKEIGAKGNGLGRTCATCSASVLDGCECADRTFVNPTRQNFHPTVKPTALMEYLVKLVTPPGGTVLDPFTGSGSTGKAALLNGFKFIGIELTADYLPIIKGRLEFAAHTFEQQAKEKETKESETLF
jgi:site-specific DNA-methyltransferase (adenine-specific)